MAASGANSWPPTGRTTWPLTARSFLESAEVYFCFAERVVRSFAVLPPELYGGSVMTESTQPSGRPARTLRASPWCREKGKEEPLFGCGVAEVTNRLAQESSRAGIGHAEAQGRRPRRARGESKNCRGESADDQEVRCRGAGSRYFTPTFWSTADSRLLFLNRPAHTAAGYFPPHLTEAPPCLGTPSSRPGHAERAATRPRRPVPIAHPGRRALPPRLAHAARRTPHPEGHAHDVSLPTPARKR